MEGRGRRHGICPGKRDSGSFLKQPPEGRWQNARHKHGTAWQDMRWSGTPVRQGCALLRRISLAAASCRRPWICVDFSVLGRFWVPGGVPMARSQHFASDGLRERPWRFFWTQNGHGDIGLFIIQTPLYVFIGETVVLPVGNSRESGIICLGRAGNRHQLALQMAFGRALGDFSDPE